MHHAFHCPDCGREHEEPAHGAFVLAVPCLDCELARAIEARPRTPQRLAPPASSVRRVSRAA